jgi:hypothetical protein
MFYMNVPYFFHLPLIIIFLLVMHDWVWGIESYARGGGNKLPPSHGWSCLVEKKLFSKPRGSHSRGIPFSISRASYMFNYYLVI